MIFKELSEGYIPEEIFFREKEMQLLNEVVDNYEMGDNSLNILCFGGTGTGKTAMIKKLMEDRGEENFIYRTIGIGWTLNQILRSILNKEYSATASLSYEIKEMLKKEPKIIVFDELNKMKDKHQLSLFLDFLNELWRETEGCPIIVLTNIFNIKENQKEDGQTALSFNPIYLDIYSEYQLKNIFVNRVKDFKDKYGVSISEKDVYNACLIATHEGNGSARQVRRILQRCCAKGNFEIPFMEEFVKGVTQEDSKEMLMRLNEREKNFIFLIYSIFKRLKKIGTREYLIYEDIERVCNLSRRTIQTYIDIIENYGFIETKFENKGRGFGKRRIIVFHESYFINNQKFLNGGGSLIFEELPELKELEMQSRLN